MGVRERCAPCRICCATRPATLPLSLPTSLSAIRMASTRFWARIRHTTLRTACTKRSRTWLRMRHVSFLNGSKSGSYPGMGGSAAMRIARRGSASTPVRARSASRWSSSKRSSSSLRLRRASSTSASSGTSEPAATMNLSSFSCLNSSTLRNSRMNTASFICALAPSSSITSRLASAIRPVWAAAASAFPSMALWRSLRRIFPGCCSSTSVMVLCARPRIESGTWIPPASRSGTSHRCFTGSNLGLAPHVPSSIIRSLRFVNMVRV
mmetsp:Transcript_45273/g.144076  ORF Transcript_45273/g.144076 Transcript_45273/m.144076 type:complete len:266 (+) Transcript_45273:640-1437(+)